MNTSPIYAAVEAENWSQATNLLRVELETNTHKFKVRFAVKCAQLVLPIFEKANPKDNRPRTAIEAAEKWIMEPTEENRKAAGSAAHAAEAAADAAADAADAAAYASKNQKQVWVQIIGMYETMVREEKLACL